MNDEPLIAIVDFSTDKVLTDPSKLVVTLQAYVDRVVKPFWGVGAQLEYMKALPFVGWVLGFFDDVEQSDSLGYHTLTQSGFPFGYVFVNDSQQNNEDIMVTASHEIAEMLLDPALNYFVMDETSGLLHALEIADPVEESFIEINGIPLSNIVTPQWYESFHKPLTKRFDFLGLVEKPFEILQGGYSMVINGDGDIDFLAGSEDKAARLGKENRKGHRTDKRRIKISQESVKSVVKDSDESNIDVVDSKDDKDTDEDKDNENIEKE